MWTEGQGTRRCKVDNLILIEGVEERGDMKGRRCKCICRYVTINDTKNAPRGSNGSSLLVKSCCDKIWNQRK
jgi:hypothetical protein